jgi:hypothetical protein
VDGGWLLAVVYPVCGLPLISGAAVATIRLHRISISAAPRSSLKSILAGEQAGGGLGHATAIHGEREHDGAPGLGSRGCLPVSEWTDSGGAGPFPPRRR